MEGFLVIMQIVALGAATVLCTYLVLVLARVKSILGFIEHDLREISARVIPVMENLEIITERVKNVTENIEEQIDIVRQSIDSVKEFADNILEFERKLQSKIEEPVMDTVGTIAALFKGVQTFVARLRA